MPAGVWKNKIFDLAANVLADVEPGYYLAGLAFIALVFFFLFQRSKKRLKEKKEQLALVSELVSAVENRNSLEKAVPGILDIIRSRVEAPGYCFYLADAKNNKYILKAIRHRNIDQEIAGPSYSGLLSYHQEEYMPPLSLPLEAFPLKAGIIEEGKIPLLSLPIKGGSGLIRLGPVKSVSPQTLRTLNYFGELLQPYIEMMREADSLKKQLEANQISSQALQHFASAVLDIESMLDLVMKLSISMIGCAGGVLLMHDGIRYSPVSDRGTNSQVLEKLERDSETQHFFETLLEHNGFCVLAKNGDEFDRIPSYLTAQGIELLILHSVTVQDFKGIAMFWYMDAPRIETHRFSALQMLTRRMADIIEWHRGYKSLAGSYVNMLKDLVRNIDNMEPYTVGYSELMSRYAGIIAREMHVNEEEREDIVLAAYFSNIGLLGFSNELIFKEGQYREEEYEKIKLHSDVGAAIIETTLANKRIASYLRHHHERIDGNGYPSGLAGGEIPLGARIIAVVQIFLAKINGRKYRDPLYCERAFQLLRAAAGTQLDKDVVAALLGWFEKKQQNPARKGKSLGACWEMRCSPLSVCQECPAYQVTDRNCWEIAGTLCENHGNRCETCFVHTEYLYRINTAIGKT